MAKKRPTTVAIFTSLAPETSFSSVSRYPGAAFGGVSRPSR